MAPRHLVRIQRDLAAWFSTSLRGSGKRTRRRHDADDASSSFRRIRVCARARASKLATLIPYTLERGRCVICVILGRQTAQSRPPLKALSL